MNFEIKVYIYFLQVFLIKVFPSDNEKRNWSVKKRYSEFLQFKNVMKRQYPSDVAFMYFPPKNMFSNNFVATFLQERRNKLQLFLNLLLENIQIQNNTILHRFLAMEHNFNLYKTINVDKDYILQVNAINDSKVQDIINNLQKENLLLKKQKCIILNLLNKCLWN